MLYRIAFESLITGAKSNGKYCLSKDNAEKIAKKSNERYKNIISHWIEEYKPEIGHLFYKKDLGYKIVQKVEDVLCLVDFEEGKANLSSTTSIEYAIKQGYTLVED